MPLQLTNPLNVGDLANDGPYSQIKVKEFSIDLEQKVIRFRTRAGNTVSGQWVDASVRMGASSDRSFVIDNKQAGIDPELNPADPAFDEMVVANQTTYDALASALYQYLIDQGFFVGTVV